MSLNFNLAFPFFRQSQLRPDNIALAIEGETWTYSELREYAQRIAGWLSRSGTQRPSRVGILASRSMETYAGILGTCWSGAAYVPISTKLPEERLSIILERTKLDALITDQVGLALLNPPLYRVLPPLILSPHEAQPPTNMGNHQQLVSWEQLPPFDPKDEPRPMSEDDLAYIIFTSGTTGTPKGVMISAGNVRSFVDAIQERYPFRPDDRVAQPSEVSFDNSVFDLFNAWESGAGLHVVPLNQLMGPLRFLQTNAITVWYSVPSFAVAMQRMKMLRPGALPSLRYSAFAGEALPQSTAETWRSAAENSVVDCLYGPTETTVVCTGDRFSDTPHVTLSRGIISIGKSFPGMEAMIVDSAQNPVPQGQEGEIAFCGKQVALGYFEDEALTQSRFPMINGRRWYLTGDSAYEEADGLLHHLGRVDNQVKIQGNRVELEEVEAHLRSACGCESVAAVAWPMQYGTAAKLIAFVTGATVSAEDALSVLRKKLPAYSVPAQIHELQALPATANGKIDRKALARMLDDKVFL
jgi:D-alanine--poly(phosphoribitol) ligase subunit 1